MSLPLQMIHVHVVHSLMTRVPFYVVQWARWNMSQMEYSAHQKKMVGLLWGFTVNLNLYLLATVKYNVYPDSYNTNTVQTSDIDPSIVYFKAVFYLYSSLSGSYCLMHRLCKSVNVITVRSENTLKIKKIRLEESFESKESCI